MILVDVFKSRNITGYIAESALKKCNILLNKNVITGDTKPSLITSGLRLGTNTISYWGFGEREAEIYVNLIDKVLSNINPLDDKNYNICDSIVGEVRNEVNSLLTSTQINSK